MSSTFYREITPYSDSVDWWNSVTINAGATPSTLQDIKLPEGAGCFTYQNSGDLSSGCSNRFIYWRTNHDVIELVEISLDVSLSSNHLRLRFQNTPILPGISINETLDEVVILIATVSAIHKLIFPHPKCLEKDYIRSKKRDTIAPSVFWDTTAEVLYERSAYFVLNHVSLGNPFPHTSCSWLDPAGNATFLLANNAGSVLMMVMSKQHGVQVTKELMKTGSVFRILNNFVPSVIKGSRTEVALNIICQHTESDVLVYSLFTDLQLRIWSHKKQDYIYDNSVHIFDTQKCLGAGNFTANQCQLRKSGTVHSSSLYLGVYVPVLSKKLFYILKEKSVQNRIELELVSILHQDQHDLVDFCIGANRIWTLWLSSENQPIVLSADLDPNFQSEIHACWLPVDLEPRVSQEIDFGDGNPQNIYVKEIFKAGRFLPSTISKAISIFNSMKNTSMWMNVTMNTDDLKTRVIEVVENEILLKAGDMDTNEKEYFDIVASCWDRFFSYCIQYHEVGMKPLGMVIDYNTGCVIVIKKNFYSLLCPCDPLQYIVSPEIRGTSFHINLLEDKKLYQGVKGILNCIDIIREGVNQKLLIRFEDKMYNLYSPVKYASEICKSLDLDVNSDFLRQLQSLIPSTSDIVASLNYLIKCLDLGAYSKDDNEEPYSRYPTFASSVSGIGALCSGLSHFAKQRFEFCRDLLLFEIIIYGFETLENDEVENYAMHSSILPRTVSLVQSYYVLLWCTQRDCVPVSATIQDASFKQFCVLELPEYASKDLTLVKREFTINHLFFQEDGGAKARKIMLLAQMENDAEDNWASLFPSLIMASARLLWPLDGNFFPEFLFSQCQFAPLQEYDCLLQELSDWCTQKKHYLKFLVATSYLILGEYKKSLKLFLNVSKEIDRESFLCQKLLKAKCHLNSSLISLLCMRVVQMFEQFSLSDCIVQLVSSAINEIEKEDPHAPIFYSLLFKHHLNLGNSEMAFSTLVKNPDESRRKDCLRQLIVYLCERKQFLKIIDLTYLDFEDEVVNILESRARCSDLSRNTSFYGILYALHVHHKKYRKAAAIMYELAMRFGKEVVNLKGLNKQVSCYLTAINCLHLSEPEYAWIVKPIISFDKIDNEENNCRESPKRDSNGDEVLNSSRPAKIEVLGLEDIRREYNLVQARLQHAQKQNSSTSLAIGPLTPEETVSLLLNASLFDSAIHLSKSFSLSLVPVFEAIAYKCISVLLHSENYTTRSDKDAFKRSDLLEDYSNNNVTSKKIWNMLESFLLRYESTGKSDLHRCVTEKLLSHGASLPAWLKLSYQKRNFTELLNLYISHGLLEDALQLMIRYIKAVLGVQKEDFNLQFSVQCNSPPVWLPHTYIDILLDATDELQDKEAFRVLHEDLVHILEEYNETVKSVTESKLTQEIDISSY